MLKVTDKKTPTGDNPLGSDSDVAQSSSSSDVDSLTEDLDQIGRFNLPKISNYLMAETFPSLRNFTSNLGGLPSLPPFAPTFHSQLSNMSSNLPNLPNVNLPNLPNVNLPNLPNVNLSHLPDLPDVSKYISQTIKQLSRYTESGGSPDTDGSNGVYDHRTAINSIKTTLATRIQMNTFLADLRNGSSFQAALDRLQTLTDVVHEAITLPVEDEEEDEEKELRSGARDQDTEPVGVLKVVNREQPLVNDLVVPDDEFPKGGSEAGRRAKKRAKKSTLGDLMYDSGTNTTDWEVAELTPEETRVLTQLDSTDDFFKQDLLRTRIQNIQKLELSQHSKNKLVTKLMMGNYLNYVNEKSVSGDNSGKVSGDGSRKPVSQESADKSANKPQHNVPDDEMVSASNRNGSIDSNFDDSNSVLSESSVDEVVLSEADTVPSFYDQGKGILGCQHYQRNCKLECPMCSKWYVCRFCHDAEISDHKLTRREVKHILCMNCSTPQAPETNYCVNCEEELANYFCLKCVLYDNDGSKDIYHCDKCGICRLGLGLSKDYFHCDTCNICLSIDLKHRHKCVTNTTHCDCPICNEYLFTSVNKVVFMKCGHSIHQQCYDEMTKHSYKCPICKKTVVNTETQFRILDQEIRQSPLPPPYDKWRCIISCNDCKGKSNCAYHVMGLKCKYCQSYNTNQLKLSKPEESDDEDNMEQDDNDVHITSMRLIKTNLSSNFLMNDQTESPAEKQEPEKDQGTEDDLMRLKALKSAEFDRSSIASIFQKFINNTLMNYDEQVSDREDSDMEAFGF